MRISTLHTFNIANNNMAKVNQEIAKTQEQLSTGKKVLSAADDPVASTRMQQLIDNISSIEQYKKNITLSKNNLVAEEEALNSVNNLVQRVEELAVQAGNTATLSASEYSALAAEVDIRINELVGLANTRNSNGDYIFSGYKSNSPAFVGDSVNGFSFQGDEGSINIKVDNNSFVQSSDSGKALFVDIPSANNTVNTSISPSNRSNPPLSISIGEVVDQIAYDDFYPEDMVISFNDDNDINPPGKNFTITEKSTGKVIESNHRYVSGEQLTYHGVAVRIVGNPASNDTGSGLIGDKLFIDSSNNQDILTTLMRFRDALNAFDGSQMTRDRVRSVVASTLSNLDSTQDTIAETVTKIGARINTLDSTEEQHFDTELVSNTILSDLRDVDYAEAASRLSAQTLVLQAAQATFLRITKLNLFSRL
ncbi:flagellar hook-associated protein 3 [Candidatus Endobugula sertula]|uniref:Flagellar hook-associated protein 3 n=1 Tax=Candidatus Endobugula sertula TaxID=62101 RepID=A0A1D2QQE3_9GAMM|nr:flagellar hook-associated protein 3 [Candidatus Endobugula sertula]